MVQLNNRMEGRKMVKYQAPRCQLPMYEAFSSQLAAEKKLTHTKSFGAAWSCFAFAFCWRISRGLLCFLCKDEFGASKYIEAANGDKSENGTDSDN